MFDFNNDTKVITEINGVRDSLIPFLISYLSKNQDIFYVAKNDIELSNVYNFLYSNFKEINIYKIPAWDCLPYDITSPNLNLIGERVKSFTDLCFIKKNKPLFVCFSHRYFVSLTDALNLLKMDNLEHQSKIQFYIHIS